MQFSSITRTTSFGGLAAEGVNARFEITQNSIVIRRSFWELGFISLILLAFAIGPLFVLGSEELRLLMTGDFGGDRWFLLIYEPFVLFVLILFIRSNLTHRPKAIVTREDRTIRYIHPGYDKSQIHANDIVNIEVVKKRKIHNKISHYCAVTVLLQDGNSIAIATHFDVEKMNELALHVSTLLSVPQTGLQST